MGVIMYIFVFLISVRCDSGVCLGSGLFGKMLCSGLGFYLVIRIGVLVMLVNDVVLMKCVVDLV